MLGLVCSDAHNHAKSDSEVLYIHFQVVIYLHFGDNSLSEMVYCSVLCLTESNLEKQTNLAVVMASDGIS
jgi:hypothetical protein